MLTTTDFKTHDHAGIRWLAPTTLALAIVMIGALFMLISPYLSR